MDAAYTPSGRKTKELLISGCLAAQPLNCWHMKELILKVLQQLNLPNINLLINNTCSSWEHLLPTWAKTFRNWSEAKNFPEARERQHRRENTASHSPCVQIKHGSKHASPSSQASSLITPTISHVTAPTPALIWSRPGTDPQSIMRWHPKGYYSG